ncbi:MAG: helix-turn-helix transcriptional regulator [Clostridia bacterium]|nr:helix-turn-helix transcriptional regulator [Clostridia bacterium]MBQ7390978.1 helix-turn-helix transcriptional regulator [Clostridia bacterium]
MTVNDAVARRITKLLQEKDMTQYRLELDSGIQHGSMQCIMNGRNKTVTLSTVIMLARGFNISLTEFLDDDLFRSEDLEVE